MVSFGNFNICLQLLINIVFHRFLKENFNNESIGFKEPDKYLAQRWFFKEKSVETTAPSSFIVVSPLQSPVCLPSPSAMIMSPTEPSSLTMSSPEQLALCESGNQKKKTFRKFNAEKIWQNRKTTGEIKSSF